MWWSNRRNFLAGALALGACGFTPVYGPGGSGEKLRNTIFVQAPTNRVEFELVRALEHRLGQPTNQVYTLKFDLKVSEESVVISAAQELNRFNVLGSLDYQLLDAADAVKLSGQVKSFTSYSASGSTLATDQAQRDAQDRLMIILADQTLNRLITSPAL